MDSNLGKGTVDPTVEKVMQELSRPVRCFFQVLNTFWKYTGVFLFNAT